MRILVVEDQKETAAVLKDKLEAEHYAVDVEHDGERGFYRARTNDYDLILLDSGLPGKSGYEICSELRGYKAKMPVLILSGHTAIEEKISLLNCGADDYMTKPYDGNELAARVKALLRRPAEIEPENLEASGAILDRRRYALVRDDKVIPLTAKEFMILEYLMKHAGNVITRGEIMEHAWNGSTDQFSKCIDVHIANLRKKIDPDDRDAFVRTVAGIGYTIP